MAASSTDRIRVLVLYWGSRGGGSLFTRLFARHIRERVPEADVAVSLRRANTDAMRFQSDGLSVLPVDLGSTRQILAAPFASLRALHSHAEAVRAFAPDLVLVTMNSPLSWPFVGFLKRDGYPLAYVAHDPRPHPGDYARTVQRLAQASLLAWADRVVTLSAYVGRQIESDRGDPERRIRVIPLETVVPVRSQDRSRAPGSPVRLLFAGRLLAYKGLPLLIDTVARLRDRRDWHLTIAGQGPMEALVREAFAGWPQVDLRLGWQTDETIDALLASHDLLLCPYAEASQSGVVALALATGLPVLVTPEGALGEQIGHGKGGIIVEGADAGSLGSALTAILDRPERLFDLSRGAVEIMRRRHLDDGWRNLVLDLAGRRPSERAVSAPHP